MFLIEDRRPGLHNFIFTQMDPRRDGYSGNVINDVTLEYDLNSIHAWPDGEPFPEPKLGRDPAKPKHYKVFKSSQELQSAGYQFVNDHTPVVVYSWRDYRQMVPVPSELAEKLGSDEWFDYLDEIDAATKLRRQKEVEPEPPQGSDLDRIAEWVAKQHLGADGSIRRVLYLPTGAPHGELRLLEVNERIGGAADRVEPIGYGIEIAGVPLSVSVADITSDQLEMMKSDPSTLPRGWDLKEARVYDGWRLRRLPA